MKNKEFAFSDMLKTFERSWTFAKLTETEKTAFHNIFNSYDICRYISGTYKQRCNQLNGMYYAFLLGVGYNNNLPRWRD